MEKRESGDGSTIIQQLFKAFVNLLKEFPRNARQDFIYDDSTLKKISKADQTLKEFVEFNRAQPKAFPDEERLTIKECQSILSALMGEMPLSPEDEFLYDSDIHQRVERAREAVVKLGDLFS